MDARKHELTNVRKERRHMIKINEQQQGYMRREAAAEYLGIAPRTLSEWQKRRLVPFVKAGRKCVMFKRDELDKAMSRLTVESVGG
jgi:excisionase family DNA binding protein